MQTLTVSRYKIKWSVQIAQPADVYGDEHYLVTAKGPNYGKASVTMDGENKLKGEKLRVRSACGRFIKNLTARTWV